MVSEVQFLIRHDCLLQILELHKEYLETKKHCLVPTTTFRQLNILGSHRPKSSKLIFKTGNGIIQTGNWNIFLTKMFLVYTKEFKIDFQNRKRNFSNRNINVQFCSSRLCIKMSSFLFVRAWAMPRILYLSCGVPFPVWTPVNISGLISVVLWLLR